MDYASMTKKELLSIAAQAEIKGRHDMPKDELVAALNKAYLDSKCAADEATADADAVDESYGDDEADEAVELDEARIEEMAKLPVRPAIVEEAEKPKFTGGNKSGNVPYKRKHYFLDMEAYESEDEQFAGALSKAPNQVRLILKCMAEQEVVDHETAMIGRDIVDLAKKEGYLTTTIPSANLFAYYRRELERFGVVHAG